MRPEEHPLYTEYRPVGIKEASIGILGGFILILVVAFWAFSQNI